MRTSLAGGFARAVFQGDSEMIAPDPRRRDAPPPVDYRHPPFALTLRQIVAELYWLGDPSCWPPALAAWASARRAALQAELLRREGVVS
jgi:hypothetical protein